jgi:two-component system sensor kinase FixL
LPDDDLLEAVDQAGAQTIRAGEIIRRMRSLISTNNADHRPESLASLISEIDFMVNLLARDAEITVRYRLAEGPDDVMVDRIQIQQVVSNLVRNATEALRDRAVRIVEINTKKLPGGWQVAVEDSGPGIAPDMADKLFYPLASGKKQGMGLGLSVSRAIIEHHHGSLWVEKSRLGGAAFCFNLPG